MEKDCRECRNFNACYEYSFGNDRWPGAVPDYFNRIRKRDLCVNNDKFEWEFKEGGKHEEV